MSRHMSKVCPETEHLQARVSHQIEIKKPPKFLGGFLHPLDELNSIKSVELLIDEQAHIFMFSTSQMNPKN